MTLMMRIHGAGRGWRLLLPRALRDAGAALLLIMPLTSTGCAPVVFSGSSVRSVDVAPPAQKRVEVTRDQIVIHEKIQFEFDSDVIKQESFDLLAEIAATIRSHPEILGLRVEGHASAEGSDDYNLELSERRANSVFRHLVEQGKIDEGRLTHAGYGESRPIASNDDEAGRARNRRVQFMITQRSDSEARDDAETNSPDAEQMGGAS